MLFCVSFDHKISVLQKSILRARRVVLQFVVSPAVSADLRYPFLGIHARTVRSIEFVAPDKIPALRCWLRRTCLPQRAPRQQQKRDESVPFWAAPTRSHRCSLKFVNVRNILTTLTSRQEIPVSSEQNRRTFLKFS